VDGVDFALSAEQRELTEAAVEFARRELNRDLIRREQAGEFSREAWQACAKFGIQGLHMPVELGGAGSDVVTTALVMESLGYGCQDNGLLFSLNAQMWAIELPLLVFGTPEQQQTYLPRMVSGDLIGSHAMTESEAGSDALNIRTRAARRGDDYLLNGSKAYVTNGPVADVLLIYANVQDGPGNGGITAFLVDASTPGLSISSSQETMGLRTSPMGELTLDDCLVPAERRLGPERAGMTIFNSSMEWERSCFLASMVGSMRRQFEECVRYARSREQFGQPIGKFQAVSGRLADMYVRQQAARAMLYRCAWLKQQGKSAPAEAAAMKVFTTEAWVRSSQDAIQIHGAFGYMKEAGIERDLRDAVASTLHSGTSEIQRVVIARMFGL
jgi:alkylation response protein AidB-like acyl-CoA dehydrogenase